MIRFAIAAAALALSASAAQATDTQVVSGSGQRAIQIAFSQGFGQSFVATGTGLTSFGFEFQTFNPGQANTPVTITLRSGSGLTGDIVATRTATLPTEPTEPNGAAWFDFDFTGTDLTAGASYTAILTTTSSLLGAVYGPDINIFTGQALGSDAYTSGQLFAGNGLSGFCTGSDSICDANFRFSTTGPAAAVPEPASWAMMLGGFGLLGGALRRRRAGSFA